MGWMGVVAAAVAALAPTPAAMPRPRVGANVSSSTEGWLEIVKANGARKFKGPATVG